MNRFIRILTNSSKLMLKFYFLILYIVLMLVTLSYNFFLLFLKLKAILFIYFFILFCMSLVILNHRTKSFKSFLFFPILNYTWIATFKTDFKLLNYIICLKAKNFCFYEMLMDVKYNKQKRKEEK